MAVRASLPRQTEKRRNKFGAVRVTRDGITFDSKREARRYDELSMLLKVQEVYGFEVHPRYELWAGAPMCEAQSVGHYTADFEVHYATGEIVVEDVKSPVTAKRTDYRLRKRLFEICHWPLTITEIR